RHRPGLPEGGVRAGREARGASRSHAARLRRRRPRRDASAGCRDGHLSAGSGLPAAVSPDSHRRARRRLPPQRLLGGPGRLPRGRARGRPAAIAEGRAGIGERMRGPLSTARAPGGDAMRPSPLARLVLYGFLAIFVVAAAYLLLDALGLWTRLPGALTRAVEIGTGAIL